MKRENMRSLLTFLFHTLMDVETVGLENVPAQGGLVFTGNHLSRLDTPLMFVESPRKDITGLVTDKYKRMWFFKWIMNSIEVIWIDRTKADFGAFRAAIDALNRGVTIGIAPEGTRSTTHALMEAKPGAVLIALKANVPLLPIALIGTDTAMHKLTHFQRAKIQVRFGKPYRLPELDRDHREESMQHLTDEMMCQIAALLPESYRGVYADCPRLKELLQEQG